MLNDASETDETCANYWPAEQAKETYSAFTVESLDKSDEIELVSRTLKLTNYYRYKKASMLSFQRIFSRSNDPAKEVKLLQLSNWPAGQPVPSSRNAVLRLVSLIDQHRSTLVRCHVLNSFLTSYFSLPEVGFYFIVSPELENLALLHRVIMLFSSSRPSKLRTFSGNPTSQTVTFQPIFSSSVLQLRAVRPQLVETLEQYRFIYEVAMEYADCEAI